MSMSKQVQDGVLEGLKNFVRSVVLDVLSEGKAAGSAEKPAKAPKAEKPAKAAPAPKAEKPAKAAKAPSSLKEHVQAAIASGKFKGNTKEGKLLASYVGLKDLRSAEARTMASEIATLLGLPPPKKPGPAPKAEKAAAPKAEKPAKAPKAEKAAKAEKAPKAAKAAKAGGTLKDQAKAALDAGKFKGNTREGKALQAFIDMKDGRSQEARTAAVEVCKLLGLPAPKKPGPAPKEKSSEAPKKAAGKKAISGKAEKDAAEASTPSPTNSPDASKPKTATTKPRALEALETVLTEDGPMNTKMVIEALKKRGWEPDSEDPNTYIYFLLTNNKDKFEKDPDKPKGYYRAVGATPKVTNGTGNGKAHSEPPPSGEVASAASSSEAEEEDLPTADADENPFDDETLGES
jgi:hypothetical protein